MACPANPVLRRLDHPFCRGLHAPRQLGDPLYPSQLEPLAKIAYCEQLYTARGLDTVFKLTPQSADLDRLLQDEGYLRDAPTSIQIMPLSDEVLPPDGTITLSPQCSEAWIAAYFELNDRNPRYLPVMWRLLDSIVPATCYASIEDNGKTVALGLAVADRGTVGFYDIVTAADARRRGYATRLMQHLLAWGSHSGAQNAYLQVMVENTPAQRLYAALGFKPAYEYWYRVKKKTIAVARPSRRGAMQEWLGA